MQQEPGGKLQGPRHVAIIMDGNGRWATERGLPRTEGHRAGVGRIRSVLDILGRHGVGHVTLYAFSTENWNRPSGEVTAIMGILREIIDDEAQSLHEQGVRIIHLGRSDRLLPELEKSIRDAEALTRNNSAMTLGVAFDYGGRGEIVQAVQSLIRSGVSADEVDEALLARRLYTKEMPDPDLIIRTGGEYRLSNFLLWQSAYSEFYTTPALWPDLDEGRLVEALGAYHKRKRRFGALFPESQPGG